MTNKAALLKERNWHGYPESHVRCGNIHAGTERKILTDMLEYIDQLRTALSETPKEIPGLAEALNRLKEFPHEEVMYHDPDFAPILEAARRYHASSTPQPEPAGGEALEIFDRFCRYIDGLHMNGFVENDFMTKREQAVIRSRLNAQAVPEGYALVPIEPTEEMIQASLEFKSKPFEHRNSALYRAMISAAQNKEK